MWEQMAERSECKAKPAIVTETTRCVDMSINGVNGKQGVQVMEGWTGSLPRKVCVCLSVCGVWATHARCQNPDVCRVVPPTGVGGY